MCGRHLASRPTELFHYPVRPVTALPALTGRAEEHSSVTQMQKNAPKKSADLG